MKKHTLSALAVAAASFAGAAHAQNTVTLYGLIDAGVMYTSNQSGSSNVQQTSGALNGSRWGLRGSEDLGGGLKTIFVLESGFSISNGTAKQGSRMFGRQAFVGLSSDQAGTVTLGRQYDSVVDNLGGLALNGTQYGGTIASHPYDNDNLNNSFRVSNSLKYQSVNYGGLKFNALYGFSNSAGGFSNNRAYSVGATYTFGGLKAGAGYLQLNNSGSTINSSGAVSDDATFTASRQRTYGAGLNYAFGAANVGFVFTQTQLGNLTAINSSNAGATTSLTGNSARFSNYEINARYAFTPAFTLSGAYTYTDASLEGVSPKYHQFTLQADYALSKRTDVYAEGAYQRVVDGEGKIHADIMGVSASNSNSQAVATVGIRHRF
ncbi:GBP family porin [Paraburkholderia bannensis]|uniref:GBP family porin n=1 Tax=Paraburkholderia bannensis TaxID=765414 RepID=A0A7W9TZA7_9BURK|nr:MULTISPECIES: porin [Paraburkholderia]MBB3258102.1 GBP family porin [Paraburkholderia sp. WP4_3_2]MBB6103115.1 GBP family porin [Paraburkholderia bannensis]